MTSSALLLANRIGRALDEAEAARLDRAAGPAPSAEDLLESLVVHETWFFRDPGAFTHLAEEAAQRPAPLTILSAPCSTGEEAYSAAIALREAGLAPGAFRITGVDVSARALGKAREGRYRPSSLRAADHAWERRWLSRAGADVALSRELQGTVTFEEANLVAPDALSGHPAFDVVFCRNLMVYLTDDAKRRLADNLARLVAPGGLLLLGPADMIDDARFTREGPADRFAFRKGAGGPSSWRKRGRRPSLSGVAPAPSPAPPPPVVERRAIDRARDLADRGRLDEAMALCERALAAGERAADAHALMGTIEHARGHKAEAMAAWQRAVLLDPDQAEATVQLALGLRAAGDHVRAAALLAHADALRERSGP